MRRLELRRRTPSVPVPTREAWVFRSKYPPRPAWPGPARRDGWHKTENLKPRVIFDWAFHVVADSDDVFFGSSADDKVYSLDAGPARRDGWHKTEKALETASAFKVRVALLLGETRVEHCLPGSHMGGVLAVRKQLQRLGIAVQPRLEFCVGSNEDQGKTSAVRMGRPRSKKSDHQPKRAPEILP